MSAAVIIGAILAAFIALKFIKGVLKLAVLVVILGIVAAIYLGGGA